MLEHASSIAKHFIIGILAVFTGELHLVEYIFRLEVGQLLDMVQ